MARLVSLIASYRVTTETYSELVGLRVSASTLEEVTTVVGKRLRDVEAPTAQLSVGMPMSQGVGSAEVAGRSLVSEGAQHLCISMDVVDSALEKG